MKRPIMDMTSFRRTRLFFVQAIEATVRFNYCSELLEQLETPSFMSWQRCATGTPVTKSFISISISVNTAQAKEVSVIHHSPLIRHMKCKHSVRVSGLKKEKEKKKKKQSSAPSAICRFQGRLSAQPPPL